ncbi:MAG TPA: DUF1549 domain-containing protein [Pirellulales bacterium]|nr:DUF1549 domain-containing protein [Pirellulales bacterium]
MWARNLLFLGLCAAGLAALAANITPAPKSPGERQLRTFDQPPAELQAAVARLNAAFADAQSVSGSAQAAERADDLTIARRLSLALAGTIPSLEEIRWFESLPAERRLNDWLGALLTDRRHHDYLAERLARAYVGVEDGPFVLFRRRRFVAWLADQLAENRPYNELVEELITESGLWTDRPATNFITVTIEPDKKKGPDASALAARVSRAFLGIRLDCAECHDHPFESWKQADFQGLAAFFGQTKHGFTGIRDREGEYQIENRVTGKLETIEPRVPYQSDLLPHSGALRKQLADWATHPQNKAFGRAIANRIWALVFGRPLVEPIDDVHADERLPPALDVLAKDFVAHGYELRRLIQVIALSDAFTRDSRVNSADEVSPAAGELLAAQWAVFPLTRLRPEQVVGGLLQSASLKTIDYDSHIVIRIARATEQSDFIKRYGDDGDDEFAPQGGTIPQRLLMMNGKQVTEKTSDSIIGNAATQIAALAPRDERVIETAYLAVLTRRPSPAEAAYFSQKLADRSDQRSRRQRVEDLVWTLLNSTEFSWNH